MSEEKKLFKHVEVLDTEKHKSLRWRCLGASCPQSCCYVPVRSSVGFSELEYLSLYFPVTFPLVQHQDGQEPRFELNIFFKLDVDKEGHCVYLDPGGKGCLLGEDKPFACKQYPFSTFIDQLGRTVVQIDLTCPGFSENENEGELILLSKTEMNAYFMKDFVNPSMRFNEDYKEARLFVEALKNYNLIKGGVYSYKGMQVPVNVVDTKALWELPKEVLRDFETRGYIKAIYFHIHSLQNYRKLIDAYLARQAQKTEESPSVFVLSP